MALGEHYKKSALDGVFDTCLKPSEGQALHTAYARGAYEMAHFLKNCQPEELFGNDQAEGSEAVGLQRPD